MLQTPRWLLRSRLWCTRGAAGSSTSAAVWPPDPRPHSPGHRDPAGGGLLVTRQTWHPCLTIIRSRCYSFLQIITVSPDMGNRSAYQVTVRGNTSYLFVSNVSAADFGEYVCRANNSIGLSSASIVVVGMYNQICKQSLAMFGSQCFQ